MLKIITININGIRAAQRKGLFEWLREQQADVICMQEIRAQAADLVALDCHLPGYEAHFHFAQKKGYSGVGIYTRHQPDQVVKGLGWEVADQEGRYVALDLGKLTIASLYMPSGTSGDERQGIKFEFLTHYANHLRAQIAAGQDFIICGDFNIAHKPIDLKNWRGNQKNSGFLPEERAWLDHVFDELGCVDAFRQVNPGPDEYTWWSNRGRAWEKNVGWRIDYQVVSQGLGNRVKDAQIYKAQRFSDHAPLTLHYDIAL